MSNKDKWKKNELKELYPSSKTHTYTFKWGEKEKKKIFIYNKTLVILKFLNY